MIQTSHEAERTAGTRIEPGRAYGFFTDTTICIGCKACEVACKQWNQLPAEQTTLTGLSYDNTRSFSATTWRHVRFVEQMEPDRFEGEGSDPLPEGQPRSRELRSVEDLGRLQVASTSPAAAARPRRPPPAMTGSGSAPNESGRSGSTSHEIDLLALAEPWGHFTSGEAWADPGSRWLLMSDVCKHCADAPCLEACPTGSIVRTEFDSVLVQQDVCNGCGYCQSACPFGVVQVDKEGDGKAHKCTLCYDRLTDGLEPACAKACPTDSIQFGPVDELRRRARVRTAELRNRGIPAYLYGDPAAEAADRSARQRRGGASAAPGAETAGDDERGTTLPSGGDTSALNGLNCFFLLIDEPEVYNLPPLASRPSLNTPRGLVAGLLTAAALTAATMAAFRGGAR